jgi:TRAP-type mannitol/chloroaromatic compound transport system substrate-binding protein
MKHIEVKFNKLIDKIVQSNSIDATEVEMIKFENLVNSYLEQKNYHKLNGEQLFVRKKVDETVREIQQLENNIGFISNASADSPLLKNVMDNINVYKEKLEVWKTKLSYLQKLDY